mmetsp:Transcript_11346/g.36308  ORF Transcript_11346/g.36308 Transcript_11346/m.36308 type:complete len:252 (+) Transcript_11346:391-1146(+)
MAELEARRFVRQVHRSKRRARLCAGGEDEQREKACTRNRAQNGLRGGSGQRDEQREKTPVSSDAAATPSRIAATVPPLAMAEPSRRLSGTAVVPISPRASGTDLGGKEGTRPLTKPGCRPHAATTAPKSTASMNATTPSAAETASVDPARRRAQQSGPLSHRKASRMALSSVSSSTPDATPEKMLHSYATLPASTNRVRACLATAFAPLGERSRIACPSERFPSIVSLPAASCNDHATATATATHQTSRWP